MALRRVVVDGGPLDAALVEAAADLFGEDVLHAVFATTQTGPVAHADAGGARRPADGSGVPLAGVLVAVADDGELLVRSPLTADGALGGPRPAAAGPRPQRGGTSRCRPVPTGA